ncbi:MAG TPA: LLM class flavin-dependent oxidoreductase [Solirubrobacteraceae bacterium]|nr:LLM class flavin-dependent oxidoreductase [Solirubrobacteraceae bacterium]
MSADERMRVAVASLGEEPTDRFLDWARLCELLGYDAVFHADEKWTRDVYVQLGGAAAVTNRIGLGISVTDPFTRHPGLTAQATATLAEACRGKLTVVMGAGSHFETLPDIQPRRQVRAIREAIELMRGLWGGERVHYDGELVRIAGAKLDWEPESAPAIWVAGRGPQVLRMAGAHADGVLMGSFATPETVAYARERIELGLVDSGRSWDDITLAAWLYVAILDDEDEPVPDDALRGVSHAFWSSRKFMTEHLDEFADDVTPEFRKFLDEAPHEWSPEVMAGLRSLVPPGIFRSLAIVGTERQVAERIAALRECGVQQCVLWPFPRPSESVEDLTVRIARTLLPSIAETRALADYQRVD